MKRCVLIIFLFILVCVSCQRKTDAVFLWTCDDSRLFLNTKDTCWKVRDTNLPYDLYVSLKHKDDFKSKSVAFRVTIDDECDTVTIQLADHNNSWIGNSRIGSYETRVKFKENKFFLNADSVLFTITPVSSNALEGIDWLAIELESK